MTPLESFTNGYLTCALWMLDENPPAREWYEYYPCTRSNLDANALAQIEQDCAQFYNANAEHIDAASLAPAKAGHNFYLTRNHHGAGFMDNVPTLSIVTDIALEHLTHAAQTFGEFELYLGDNGAIYH